MIEFLIGIAVVIGGVFMCVAVWLGLRMLRRELPLSKEYIDKWNRSTSYFRDRNGKIVGKFNKQ